MRKIAIDLRIPDPLALRLAPHAEVQLARIIQEALTNVAKHAHANKSVVSIECRESFATAIVEDDGKGFMLDAAGSSGLHFGLNTMRERAQAVGGECAIDSAPGKGTRIIVRLPLERNNRDEAHTGAVG